MIRIVERYIFGSFLTAFVFAFLVLSVVLSVGGLGESVHLVGRGVSSLLVLRICVLTFPEVLTWSVPLAALVSSFLVFARLSSDGELAAMRTCGIGIWTMIRLPVVFGVLCTASGCWMTNVIAPRGHHIRKTLQVEFISSVLLQTLEPGRIYALTPEIAMSFERRGESGFHGLTLFERMEVGDNRRLTADYAVYERHGRMLDLRLTGVTSETAVDGREMIVRAESLRQTINGGRLCKTYEKRCRDCDLGELLKIICKLPKQIAKAEASNKNLRDEVRVYFLKKISNAKVEIARRFALAMAPLCFVLIGMPLGMRSRQKLSGPVLAGMLVLPLGYYMPIIAASGEGFCWPHPELLPFVPIVVFIALAVRLLKNMR